MARPRHTSPHAKFASATLDKFDYTVYTNKCYVTSGATAGGATPPSLLMSRSIYLYRLYNQICQGLRMRIARGARYVVVAPCPISLSRHLDQARPGSTGARNGRIAPG